MSRTTFPNQSEAGDLSDSQIINHVLTGDKNLFGIIMRRYNERLYRIGMSILKDDTEVEDAMQVAYIKAYENLWQFVGRSSFATWLTRILINECLYRLKQKNHHTDWSDNVIENSNNQLYSMGVQTPDTPMLNVELKKILEDAILQLPEKYRTVFIMRELEDMNVAETVACLKISEANVKVRLNRAKVLLRNLVTQVYKKEELFHFHLTRCDRIVAKVLQHLDTMNH
jgi:RNA polymerase sigma-70 factor (ECF subfamily)